MINFGTRTPLMVNGASITVPNMSHECFPIRIGGRANPPGSTTAKGSVNFLAEDCIFEQPYPSNARETTCVVAVAANGDSGSVWTVPTFAGLIRNCYFNLEYINPRSGNPVRVHSITPPVLPDTLATIQTRFPHNVKANDYVELMTSQSALNKRWKVEEIVGAEETSRILKIDLGGITPSATGPMSLFKSEAETLPVTLSIAGGFVQVDTGNRKHNRTPSDEIVISGADDEAYNGTFPILSIIENTPSFMIPCSLFGSVLSMVRFLSAKRLSTNPFPWPESCALNIQTPFAM